MTDADHMRRASATERDDRPRDITAREQAATKGPWWGDLQGDIYAGTGLSDDRFVAGDIRRPDADFIAHARADIPWLLDEVARLADVETRLRSTLAVRDSTDARVVARLAGLLADRDATIRRLADERPVCDGGCTIEPEEECSLHGRPVAEVWQIVSDREREIGAKDATIQAVQAALDRHPTCDIYPDAGPFTCGWQRAVADVLTALDPGQTDGDGPAPEIISGTHAALDRLTTRTQED